MERHGHLVHMGPAQIDRADRWFQRYGDPAVLFGRMIPLVRAFVSLPAGVAKMPLLRFTVLTIIGSIPWVLALALAGHALGSEWTSVRKGFEYVDYAIVALVVVGIGYWIVRRRRAGQAAAVEAAGAGPRSHVASGVGTRRRWLRDLPEPPRPRSCRCATHCCSASCRAPPRCCRSPPRRTSRCCRASRAGPARRPGYSPELRNSLEVALHAGTVAALALALRGELGQALRELDGRALASMALALAPPAFVGYLMEQRLERRPSGPRALAAGLAVGASRWPGPTRARRPAALADFAPRDGLALGLAQALALLPGVSRNGATLTAARARGFAREDAQALSWRVGLPVIAGAAGLKASPPRPARRPAGRGSRARSGRGCRIPIDARLRAADRPRQACAGAVAVRALPRGAGAGRGGVFGLGLASRGEADQHRSRARRHATINTKSSYDPSMAMTSARRDPVSQEHRRSRAVLGAGLTLVLIVVLLAVAVLAFSGVTLASDSTALARVSVQPLGGTVERVRAYGPHGRRVPLAIEDGRLTPLRRLSPGEQVTVDVEVRRPGWLSWALGSERNEQLTLRAPAAQVTERWMTVPSGSEVRVSFDRPVSRGVLRKRHGWRDPPHAEQRPRARSRSGRRLRRGRSRLLPRRAPGRGSGRPRR